MSMTCRGMKFECPRHDFEKLGREIKDSKESNWYVFLLPSILKMKKMYLNFWFLTKRLAER